MSDQNEKWRGGFGHQTKLRMFDASVKSIDEIKVGDVLLGQNGSPVQILDVKNCENDQGYSLEIFKVETIFISKKATLVTLSRGTATTKRDEQVRMSVLDYLKLPKWQAHALRFFKEEMTFLEAKADLPIDPYVFGYWLGRGDKLGNFSISSQECYDHISTRLQKHNLTFDRSTATNFNLRTKHYKVIPVEEKEENNVLTTYISSSGLEHEIEKCIAYEYKTSTKENRLQLMAGIIDSLGYIRTHGYIFDFSMVNEQLFYDIVFLGLSLGFNMSVKENVHDPSINEEEERPKKRRKKEITYRGYMGGEIEVVPTVDPSRALVPRKQFFRHLHVSGLKKDLIDMKTSHATTYWYKTDSDVCVLLDTSTIVL
jgi:replicative DNA helicase